MFDNARNRVIFALISGVVAYVVRKSFFERIVLIEHSKNGRFVSVSAKIWICGLYLRQTYNFSERKLGYSGWIRTATGFLTLSTAPPTSCMTISTA